MGVQSGLPDRAQFIRFIQFLQRQGKQKPAQELMDILRLQEEARELGKQSPRLLEWIDQLEPVLPC